MLFLEGKRGGYKNVLFGLKTFLGGNFFVWVRQVAAYRLLTRKTKLACKSYKNLFENIEKKSRKKYDSENVSEHKHDAKKILSIMKELIALSNYRPISVTKKQKEKKNNSTTEGKTW